jgi:WD40 repeat protein
MAIKRTFGFAVLVVCIAVSNSLAVTVKRRALLADAINDGGLVRLSADSQLLASGSGRGPVKLWDTQSGKLIAELKGTEGQSPRAFSPVDDRLLVSTQLKSLSLYDLKSMKLRSSVELEKPLGSASVFERFSPDGELFVVDSAGKNQVTVWETKTARMLSSRACSVPLFKSTFSPDSKTIISSCGDRKATLWDAQTGNVIAEFSHDADVLLATFSADAKMVTTITTTGQVMNWDAATGSLQNSWASQKSIFYAAFSPDRQVLGTVSWNGQATLWDVASQREKNSFRVSRNANHINFSPDGRFVTANGHAGEVSVFNVADGSPVLNITEHEKDLRYVIFSADTRLAVSYSDDAVNVWDLVTRTHVAKLSDAVAMALLSQDGKLLVTGGIKGSMILWDVNSQ